MMKPWLVRLSSGQVAGPYTEAQIRSGLRRGRIDDSMQLRQEASAWTPAPVVRRAFDLLSQQGFYLKNELGQIFGPFTKSKLLELRAERRLPRAFWIRQGDHGAWKPVNAPRPRQLPGATSPAARDASTIQLPLCIPAAPVMRLRDRPWYTTILASTRRILSPFPGWSRTPPGPAFPSAPRRPTTADNLRASLKANRPVVE